jgi:Tol biopolymer transport system component
MYNPDFFGPMTGSSRWSPDGRMPAFDSRHKGRSVIFISASGSSPVRITTGAFDNADNVVSSWSCDGQSLYFSSHRTGRWEVWRKWISSDESQITRQGGFNGVESPDGTNLYCVQDTVKNTIWRVPLSSSSKSQQVSGALGTEMSGYWTVVGENLFYLQRQAGGFSPAAIFRLNLKTASKVRLGQIQFGVNDNDKGLAISSDGRWFLYAQRDVDRSSIMLVNDWY